MIFSFINLFINDNCLPYLSLNQLKAIVQIWQLFPKYCRYLNLKKKWAVWVTLITIVCIRTRIIPASRSDYRLTLHSLKYNWIFHFKKMAYHCIMLFLFILCPLTRVAQDYIHVSVCPLGAREWQIEAERKTCQQSTPNYLCAALEN